MDLPGSPKGRARAPCHQSLTLGPRDPKNYENHSFCRQYKVIYINDEVTTMDFVIMSLITVFNHSPEMAQSLCDEVHEKGAGTAAIMPYEMAEQKGVEVTQLARNAGFPLQIKLEPTE